MLKPQRVQKRFSGWLGIWQLGQASQRLFGCGAPITPAATAPVRIEGMGVEGGPARGGPKGWPQVEQKRWVA